MAELFRYAAFVSYSSKDAAFARRLHRALEGYSVPTSLGRFDLIGGGKNNRIYPVFRDREELSAGDLGERIEAALKANGALIVVCSPSAAASPWVQKEIVFFVSLGRRDRIFAIIADTAPLLGEGGADVTPSCFPPAFRGKALEHKTALEPLAADARKEKDGFRNAFLKVVGGLIGVTPGQIIDRDRKRRVQQRVALGGIVAALTIVAASTLAWFDARTWRTRLSTYAEVVAQDHRPLEALGVALAGAPAQGGLLPARSDRADAVLTRVGSTRIRYDFGRIFSYEMSDDGAVVVTLSRDGNASYFNFARGAERIYLGEARHVELSRNGAAVLITDWDKEASVRNLARNGEKMALGLLDSSRLADDGSALAVQGDDGEGAYYDLAKGGAKTTLDKIADFDMSANGRAVVVKTAGGAGLYYDFAKGGAKTPLGSFSRTQHFFLSPDASKVIAFGDDLVISYYDVAKGGAKTVLGPYNTWTMSADGAILVALVDRGEGSVYDLAHGSAKTSLGRLGTEPRALLSRNGTKLVVMDDEGRATLFDLGNGAARRDLGKLERVALASNGAAMVTWRDDERLVLHDLTHGGAETDLGPGNELREYTNEAEAAENGFFVQFFDGHASFFDLLKGGAKTDLGILGNLLETRMSRDGAVVIVQTRDGASTRFVPASKVESVSLGDLLPLRDIALSRDGGALLVRNHDSDETGVLYDLAASPPTLAKDGRTPLRGESLTASVCRASGDAVRPFPLRLRAQGAEANQAKASDGDQRLYASSAGGLGTHATGAGSRRSSRTARVAMVGSRARGNG